MQTNSDLIKNLGILAEEVYDNDNFLVGKPINADGTIYTVVATQDTVSATSGNDAGFQAFLLQNNATQEYVIAFRGTEDSFNPFSDEGWKDGYGASIAMAIGDDMVAQMELALLFVKELAEDDAYTFTQSNTTFTGHSLGGSLASVAGYTYGFDTYTYNGFGVRDILEGSDYSNFISTNNITSLRAEDTTTNIIHVGGEYVDIVTGAATNLLGHGHIGELLMVKDHTGGYLNIMGDHLINPLNQSIAIYNNLLTLFPHEDYTSLSATIGAIQPQGVQVERFLTSLGEIVSATTADNHVIWSENISGTGITNLTLENLTDTSAASLEAQATNPAYLYALLSLNPFAITGAEYSHLNQNGALDSDNYSEQFIEDRAMFLYALTHPDENHFTEYDTGFVDDYLNISADVEGSTVVSGGVPNVYEWGNGEAPIDGGGGDDHLYGTYLNDVIDGSDGDDYIEGGLGQDTMAGGDGNDTFYVQGFDQDENYDTFDGGTGDEDPGKGDIIQGSDGDDGIRINELTLDHSIEKIDGGGGVNFIQGTTGNDTINLTNTEVTNINAILGEGGTDNIIGSDGDDTIIGGASDQTTASQFRGGKGNDNILATSGRNNLFGGINHDLLVGGSGEDHIYGGSGNDWLLSRKGNDQLEGGIGYDRYFAMSGDTVKDRKPTIFPRFKKAFDSNQQRNYAGHVTFS